MSTKLTIHSLAKKARVSVATISRAINPETRSKVAAETLTMIDELIREYGYTPNLAARNLRKTSHKIIGVLFPHHEGILLSEYYSQILSGVADYLLNSDFCLKMILLKPEKAKWDTYDFEGGEGVDGLIVTYWRTFFSDSSVLKKMNLPCVIINNIEENVKAHFVAGDHFQGGQMAAQYLYFHGHRKIAVLSGYLGSPDSKRRLEGFRSFLDLKGIRLGTESIFDADTEEKAYQITVSLLAKRSDITALFCMNDILAFGVLKRLKELGVSCPEKISVMGYDNDRQAEHSSPPLTTIQASVYDAAKMAAERLIQYLREKDSKKFFYTSDLLPVTLVERKSVRKIG